LIPEKLFDISVDPKEYIDKLLALNPQALENETAGVLQKFGFPNTYTFSKHMAE